MLSTFLRAALIFALLLTGPGMIPSARAQTIDAAGAENVKKVVSDALAYYLEAGQKTGEGLKLGGEIAVTPKGSFYEVKIPDAALVSESATVKIGTVMMNVTPEKGGDFRTSIAVPQQISMKDAKGVDRMTISFGSQKFSGVWKPALQLFTQAVADYGDINVAITPDTVGEKSIDPVHITMGRIGSSIAMTSDRKGLWSGPQTTTAQDIVFTFGPGKASRLAIDKVDGTVKYSQIDLGIAKALRDQLREHMQKGGAGLTAAALQALMKNNMSSMKSVPQRIESDFTVQGVGLDLPASTGETAATPAAKTPVSLRLASLTSHNLFDGMKADAGNATTQVKLQGLTLTGHSGPLTGIIPNEANVNVNMTSIPFKSMTDIFMTAMNSALEAQSGAADLAAAEAQTQTVMMQALSSIGPMMAKAGTTLSISDTYTRAADLTSTLDGSLKATAGAPYVFTGLTTLTLNGMDELITKLQQMAKDSNNPSAAGYAQLLIFLQLSGKLDQGPDGKSRRTYAVELKPDGAVLLNGADLKGVIPESPESRKL